MKSYISWRLEAAGTSTRSKEGFIWLVKKLGLAWDPDYTRATPSEDAAMEQAAREMEAGDYVPDSAINWD